MPPLIQRLYPAIRLLVGPEPVKQRLVKVWLEYLDDIAITELPTPVQNDFRALRQSMYDRVPLPHETAPEASVRKMSIREATSHAESIVNILNKLGEDSGILEFRSAKLEFARNTAAANIPDPRGKSRDRLLN